MNVIAIATGKVICKMAGNNDGVVLSRANWKDTAMTGALPDDFLIIEGQSTTIMPQQPVVFSGFQQSGGILSITCVQARLAKNYGVTRMDPYCRMRVGVQIFETPSSYNGSKTPRWNKVIQCHIPDNIKEFYLEIFDERTFSVDEKIAWGLITIKDDVFSGEIVDDWYSLSGKQGDDKEGLINIVLQYRKMEGAPVMMGGPMITGGAMMYPSPVMYPGGGYMYGYPPPVMYAPPHMTPQQQVPAGTQQPAVVEVNEKDLNTLQEMCPDMDKDIIKSVLLQSGGNLDRAAVQLLEMAGGQ